MLLRPLQGILARQNCCQPSHVTNHSCQTKAQQQQTGVVCQIRRQADYFLYYIPLKKFDNNIIQETLWVTKLVQMIRLCNSYNSIVQLYCMTVHSDIKTTHFRSSDVTTISTECRRLIYGVNNAYQPHALELLHCISVQSCITTHCAVQFWKMLSVTLTFESMTLQTSSVTCGPGTE